MSPVDILHLRIGFFQRGRPGLAGWGAFPFVIESDRDLGVCADLGKQTAVDLEVDAGFLVEGCGIEKTGPERDRRMNWCQAAFISSMSTSVLLS
jgi:hypothetical protein